MSAWQPIETAPKDGTEVLVWEHDATRTAYFDATAESFRVNAHSFVRLSPTYWMPLPSPPENTGEGS